MTDVASGRRVEVGSDEGQKLPMVDVDVHEMLTSIRDLVPYLEEPWRSRIAINDAFKGPPGNPYAFPQATGVAIADAVTDDGSPAGSKLELLQEQVLDRFGVEPAPRSPVGEESAEPVHPGARQILDAADRVP